jgi:hypothetical protein
MCNALLKLVPMWVVSSEVGVTLDPLIHDINGSLTVNSVAKFYFYFAQLPVARSINFYIC